LIDVAVAVSYPEQFQVGRAGDMERSALDEGSLRRRWAYAGPMYYDPFYAPWGLRYGFGYRYGYGYEYGYALGSSRLTPSFEINE